MLLFFKPSGKVFLQNLGWAEWRCTGSNSVHTVAFKNIRLDAKFEEQSKGQNEPSGFLQFKGVFLFKRVCLLESHCKQLITSPLYPNFTSTHEGLVFSTAIILICFYEILDIG